MNKYDGRRRSIMGSFFNLTVCEICDDSLLACIVVHNAAVDVVKRKYEVVYEPQLKE